MPSSENVGVLFLEMWYAYRLRADDLTIHRNFPVLFQAKSESGKQDNSDIIGFDNSLG